MIIRELDEAVAGGQTLCSLRWRVLLGILAEQEAQRLGWETTQAHLDEMARWFRREFELPLRADVEDFLRFADLDLAAFTAQMHTFSQLVRVQAHHEPRLIEQLPRYLAFERLEHWHEREHDGD